MFDQVTKYGLRSIFVCFQYTVHPYDTTNSNIFPPHSQKGVRSKDVNSGWPLTVSRFRIDGNHLMDFWTMVIPQGIALIYPIN